jgi:predicted oxidoreductase
MKKYFIGSSHLSSSRLMVGTMRIAGDGSTQAINHGKKLLLTAIDNGINHFDFADIYGKGMSESIMGDVLKDSPHLRRELIFTSKCGVKKAEGSRPPRYDLSKLHIIKSVEASLKRLNTSYLDMLLLHRPDFLMNPSEITETFDTLFHSGKVNHFGVSNFSASQVNMLQSKINFPIMANQVEINLHRIDALTDGVLDQCQAQNISPQAWCPLGGVAYSAWGNTFAAADELRIEKELKYQAEKYRTEESIIALAWLLKHPATIFPIIGSTNPERIIKALEALEIPYKSDDWYRLLEARNGFPVA